MISGNGRERRDPRLHLYFPDVYFSPVWQQARLEDDLLPDRIGDEIGKCPRQCLVGIGHDGIDGSYERVSAVEQVRLIGLPAVAGLCNGGLRKAYHCNVLLECGVRGVTMVVQPV